MPFNPDRINIHELTIEEPERRAEVFFDAEKDITKEDWKGMEGKLEEYRRENKWDKFSQQAMRMKILDPNQDLNIDLIARNGIREILEEDRKSCVWNGFASQATEMKMLGIDQELNIDQVALQGTREMMEGHRQRMGRDRGWDSFSWMAMNLKIIDPTQDLNLDQVAWHGMRDTLEKDRQQKSWADFSWGAVKIKILDPNQDLNLDQEAWQGMRDYLEKQRENGDKWGNLSWQLANMKILVAEKVEVTENGIELTMPKKRESLGSDAPPIPEIKKF